MGALAFAVTRRAKGKTDFASSDGGCLRECNKPFKTLEVSGRNADSSDHLIGKHARCGWTWARCGFAEAWNVSANKKSHPHGWLDWFINRFARLAYAARLRLREAYSRLRAPSANSAKLEGSGTVSITISPTLMVPVVVVMSTISIPVPVNPAVS